MSEQQTLIAGRYQLEQLIGRGGMGDVYRGVDTHTGTQVAIKQLHVHIVDENPDIVDRFLREGEALRRLDHPNIVKLLGAVEENGKHYLIMEHVGGGSLRDLIEEEARLPLEAVLNIALDLADALTRAHRLNIIHRDIKPDNVLLAEDGTPRLTDFGVAHLRGRTRLTQTGSVIGTYAYLSPEACNGLELDERADIWSFGVMLFEMLAGRVPFGENSTAAILTAILTKPAPDITRLRPGTPEPLADLIARMLEKDRERRISSVRVVGAELEALIRGLDTPLRDLVQAAGQDSMVGSRFSTPSDEVPAMARSTPQQTHGLSLYPSAQAGGTPPPPSYAPGAYTPGGTPITSEIVPAATKWKWIALMVIVTVLACSMVSVIAILLGPESRDRDTNETEPASLIPGVPGVTLPLTGGASSGTRPPIVAPVADDEFMVLIAPLEPLSGANENDQPARFVANDLKMALEETVPYSNIRVRTHPSVITSDEEAHAAAEAAGASVILWGNYSADLIELEVQMGVTEGFPYLAFPREVLERSVNVRVHLSNPQRESAAPYVLNVLNILHNAAGNSFEALRTGEIQNAVTVTPAELVGNTVAANMHRIAMATDETTALAYLKDAQSLDAGNALLYIYSSIIKQRAGQFDDARRDALTAQRIGPPGWSLPLLVTAAMTEDETVLDLFNQVIEQRPNDWFPYFFRGAIYYELHGLVPNGYQRARADLEHAIALGPGASFPYIYSALLALHEGRLEDAGAIINLVLNEFPDPDYMQRLVQATFSDEVLSPFSLTLSAFTNLTLGQYGAVLEATAVGIEEHPTVSDIYLQQGLAHCGLGDFASAETSFSTGLEHDPEFVLLHLLRADARLQQGDEPGAQDDIAAIEDSALSANFAPLVEAVRDSTLSCATFFSPENPFFDTSTSSAGSPAYQLDETALQSVAPVEPGEHMVLVASMERLDDAAVRDVTRFVAEDLRRTFEEEIQLSRLRVRQYPAVITSGGEARAVAQRTGAAVMVWGSYTADRIELEVQVGVTDGFPHLVFPRETLEQTANVRVHLVDERRQSVAQYVLNVFNLLANADGDEFGVVLNMMQAASLDAHAAEVSGGSLAAHLHRALAAYGDDMELTFQELDAAIARDPGNPLPYVYRSMAYMRTSDAQGHQADTTTMQRLAPEGWAMPLFWTAEENTLTARQAYDQLAQLRPDDWFVFFLRGVFYYYTLKDFDQARADFDQSIALGPTGNLPYIAASMIALRQGEMSRANDLFHTVLTEYPDPELTNRAMRTVYGEAADHFIGPFFAAATNYALGQYDDVISQIQAFTTRLFERPEGDALIGQQLIELGDLYTLQGLTYCNLGDYAAAEAAYDRAIGYSGDFTLLYLLRGQARQMQGKVSAAEDDFAAARDHTLGAEFDAWVEGAAAQEWTCETMTNYQPVP